MEQDLSHGFEVVMFDDNAISSNVMAVHAAYPNVTYLADIDMAGLMSGTWNDQGSDTSLNQSSSNYVGYAVVNYLNILNAPYTGIYFDDCHPAGSASVQDVCNLLDWVKSRYPNYLIAGNIGPLGWAPIQNHLDVWSMEGCFNGWLPNSGFSQNWCGTPQQNINQIVNWTESGGSSLAFCELSTFNYTVAEQYDTLAMCTFDLACYLCAVQPSASGTAYFCFNQAASTSTGWFPIMNINPGVPIGSYTQNGNVLTRQFTKCNVTVDLTAHIGNITI
jgi:hypothetical protein